MSKDDKNPPDNDPKELIDAMKKIMEQGFTMKTDIPRPEEPKKENETPAEEKPKKNVILDFKLKPKDIKKHLDKFVIKQDEAKRVLSTAVCDHYNHSKRDIQGKGANHYSKQNVLLLGPTGVGKTYLVKCLADFIGVPFIKADATKFSETGYVGGDVDDLVRGLLQKADGDIELAQHGIIYLDEIDKLAFQSNNMGRDVSGGGVQRGLLKIMEETEVSARNPQDMQSQFEMIMNMQKGAKKKKNTLNTKHILFIASGAFTGLDEIIEKRISKKTIGFDNEDSLQDLALSELFAKAETSDLISYGFEPEFVGRLPVRVSFEQLSEEDLYTILRDSEESILKQYQYGFTAYGIDCQVDDKAIWEMAKIASKEKTGARALYTVCEGVFRNLKYELPSSSIKKVRITAEMILDSKSALDELLKEDREILKKELKKEIQDFEKSFSEKSGITVTFDESATTLLIDTIIQEEKEPAAYLSNLLSNYTYGLKLIQQMKPQEVFTLTEDVVRNPNGTLDTWIKASYEKNGA